ncbi:MAG: hypothetical protein CM15mP101_12960 [Flavobacteriaceae bacterium]|nr:MAG: hypothetical protein CM15mP101_12960 [Flavobacteriaceae bacterium]
MEAAIKENKKIGLRSTAHHAQLNVVKWNVLNSARAGLTSMEHWYGLPEALFNNRIIQNYPPNYNYQNEQHRFEEAGKLWAQAAEPFSDHWNNVMNELISLDFTISPTLNIYEASRDLTELDELSGMMITPCLVYGDSTHPVGFHTVLIGITGELSRRLLGKKITGFG